jgi:hypothetical protein
MLERWRCEWDFAAGFSACFEAGRAMEVSVKLTRALEIAGKARIRRRIAAPSDNTEVPPPERPIELRDARGRLPEGLGWWPRSAAARRSEGRLYRRLVCRLEEAWSAGDQAIVRRESGGIFAACSWPCEPTT